METARPAILLVEDNPNDLELTLRALGKVDIPHEVTVAKDGAHALDLLFAAGASPARWSCVILDLKLPKTTGIEVLRRLKGDPHTRRIPVVMWTSSQQDKDITESYALGVNSYVVKPVDFRKYTRTVQDIGRYWLQWNLCQPAS